MTRETGGNDAARRAREAAALRANLARRKAQARARSAAGTTAPEEPDSRDPTVRRESPTDDTEV